MSTGWPYPKGTKFIEEGCVFPPTDAPVCVMGIDLAEKEDVAVALQPWQRELLGRMRYPPRNRRDSIRLSDIDRACQRVCGKSLLGAAVAVEDIT